MEDLELVEVLWNFMQMNHEVKKADCIIVLGCSDISVVKRATELYFKGYSDKIIFTGGLGKITNRIWSEPEAEIFAKRAIELGVPESAIYKESKSGNTGDNFRFTKRMIEEENLDIKTCILVSKPYNEKRVFAAFKKIMPEYEGIVTSLKIDCMEYYEKNNTKEDCKNEWIDVMLGDVQRLRIFPEKGWQVEVDVPDEIWNAYEELVKRGYDKYIIKK